ncbi:hypothetical protein C6502_13525 [Candidatus Poribacteria bacterium]|nr:MAG: hypothetical protein C6502_13525 [Candidatus Poribacteria bacterium]
MKCLCPLVFILLIFLPQILPADSVQIRNIIVTGNEAFSSEKILGLMQSQVGDDYDPDLLHQDFQWIASFYQMHGYQFARVDEEQLVLLKFSDGVYLRIYIDEGRIGRITIKGNTRTKTDVIRKELLFKRGDVYIQDDELESERILRRKPYLGSAEILATRDPETNLILIEVEVTDLWTFFPALDVPAFSKDKTGFLVALSDSNVFGSGDSGRIRYEQIREEGEDPRHLVSGLYRVFRLFDSHWEFDGVYTQKREGVSWEASLKRPLYSLQTRWSAAFTAAESVDERRWYEQGKKTAVFDRSSQSESGQIIRSFGDRRRQTQIALWMTSERVLFDEVERLPSSTANFQDRNARLIGVSLGHRKVNFIRTRFLNKMGRVEDIGVGYGYSVSIGRAHPFYGSDRRETRVSLFLNASQAYQDLLFVNGRAGVTTRFVAHEEEDSAFEASIKAVRKNLFLRQTLAARISTQMQFGLEGEQQVLLGGNSGLRGYDPRQFSGTKRIRLNLESRTIFWEHPLVVIGSAIFADVGYIWEGDTSDIGIPKRSVGFGVRLGLPKLSGSRVYRADLAYPLDGPEKPSLMPVFTYAIGHAF